MFVACTFAKQPVSGADSFGDGRSSVRFPDASCCASESVVRTPGTTTRTCLSEGTREEMCTDRVQVGRWWTVCLLSFRCLIGSTVWVWGSFVGQGPSSGRWSVVVSPDVFLVRAVFGHVLCSHSLDEAADDSGTAFRW